MYVLESVIVLLGAYGLASLLRQRCFVSISPDLSPMCFKGIWMLFMAVYYHGRGFSCFWLGWGGKAGPAVFLASGVSYGILLLGVILLARRRLASILYESIARAIPRSTLLDLSTGFTEEGLFRGVMLHVLISEWNPMASNLIQSALFGAFHIRHGKPGGGWGAMYAMGLGLVLGWFVLHSGTILPGIVIHGGLLPAFLLLVAVLRRQGIEVRLYRYRWKDRHYLATRDGRVVLSIDEVTHRILSVYDRFPEEKIPGILKRFFPASDVRQAMLELRGLETRGCRLMTRREYRFPHPNKAPEKYPESR